MRRKTSFSVSILFGSHNREVPRIDFEPGSSAHISSQFFSLFQFVFFYRYFPRHISSVRFRHWTEFSHLDTFFLVLGKISHFFFRSRPCDFSSGNSEHEENFPTYFIFFSFTPNTSADRAARHRRNNWRSWRRSTEVEHRRKKILCFFFVSFFSSFLFPIHIFSLCFILFFLISLLLPCWPADVCASRVGSFSVVCSRAAHGGAAAKGGKKSWSVPAGANGWGYLELCRICCFHHLGRSLMCRAFFILHIISSWVCEECLNSEWM